MTFIFGHRLRSDNGKHYGPFAWDFCCGLNLHNRGSQRSVILLPFGFALAVDRQFWFTGKMKEFVYASRKG